MLYPTVPKFIGLQVYKKPRRQYFNYNMHRCVLLITKICSIGVKCAFCLHGEVTVCLIACSELQSNLKLLKGHFYWLKLLVSFPICRHAITKNLFHSTCKKVQKILEIDTSIAKKIFFGGGILWMAKKKQTSCRSNKHFSLLQEKVWNCQEEHPYCSWQ